MKRETDREREREEEDEMGSISVSRISMLVISMAMPPVSDNTRHDGDHGG